MICPICRISIAYQHTHRLNDNYTVRYRIEGDITTIALGGDLRGWHWHNDVIFELDGIVSLDADKIERLLLLK